MKKLLTYGAGLIGLYLLVEYSTGSGVLLNDGAAGTTSIIKSLQGR